MPSYDHENTISNLSGGFYNTANLPPNIVNDSYVIYTAENYRPNFAQSPVVISSPHSGSDYAWMYPSHFYCTLDQLRLHEDMYVDELCKEGLDARAVLIAAKQPRVFIDFNRPRNSLHADQIRDGALLLETNEEDEWAKQGSGLYMTESMLHRFNVYSHLPSELDVVRHLRYWDAYHSALQEKLLVAKYLYSCAVLLDMHSCDSSGTVDANDSKRRGKRPDIMLGDMNGTTASGDLMSLIESSFIKEGLSVDRNKVFPGGYITEHYGRPQNRILAVQIELNKRLYMNQKTFEKKPKAFANLRSVVGKVIKIVHDYAEYYPHDKKFTYAQESADQPSPVS